MTRPVIQFMLQKGWINDYYYYHYIILFTLPIGSLYIHINFCPCRQPHETSTVVAIRILFSVCCQTKWRHFPVSRGRWISVEAGQYKRSAPYFLWHCRRKQAKNWNSGGWSSGSDKICDKISWAQVHFQAPKPAKNMTKTYILSRTKGFLRCWHKATAFSK